jgi:hypothetical protein
MLQYDRHGHGGERIADTNADTHANTYADSDTYTHIYTDTSSISYPDGDTYAHIYTDASPISYPDSNAYAHIYTGADPDIYSGAYPNGHANTNADVNSIAPTNAYADAMRGKVYANAEAGSDSGAACHGTASDSCHVPRSYSGPHTRGSYSCRG